MPAFQNILIPVDFSSNTRLAVKRVIELADKENASIHLVHVTKSGLKPAEEYSEKLRRLKELEIEISLSLPEARIEADIVRHRSLEKALIAKANAVQAELIVLPRRSGKKIFSFTKRVSPARLARQSHCAVLTLKPGSEETKIKSIVIPFHSGVPRKKLEILAPLAWKKNITVYLVAMLKELRDFELGDAAITHSLIETYRLLKEGEVNCQVEHRLITGNNVAKSMLRFAESVNADVLLATADEIKLSGRAGLDISDLLDRDSRIQLLTIEPETHIQYP